MDLFLPSWTTLPFSHGPTRSTEEATSPTELLAPKAQVLEEVMGNISIPTQSSQMLLELPVRSLQGHPEVGWRTPGTR